MERGNIMYGMVIALPKIYVTHGNDEVPTDTIISKLKNIV